jgi:hypothetical protein
MILLQNYAGGKEGGGSYKIMGMEMLTTSDRAGTDPQNVRGLKLSCRQAYGHLSHWNAFVTNWTDPLSYTPSQ